MATLLVGVALSSVGEEEGIDSGVQVEMNCEGENVIAVGDCVSALGASVTGETAR